MDFEKARQEKIIADRAQARYDELMAEGKHGHYETLRQVVLEESRNAYLQGRGSAAKWLPIESAPKDRFVFLYCPEDKSRWLAKWQEHRWHGVDELGLTREGMGPEDVTGWAVTHWQELPLAPNPQPKG
jgi:hypothetical protein